MHNSSVPLFWRLKDSKYRMVGTKCANCGTFYFPPRHFCPKCRRDGKIEEFKFTGKGTIVSHTVIRTAPSGFEKSTPYVVGIVKLDEGPQISGQIVGGIREVEIGKKVKPVFRKMYEDGDGGLIHYGFKFELDDSE
ncbi:MAG: transcriptional regulator [Candidatus Aenigmatarchaeota archaeon]|nr:MAG: transcriptional regulator [Candidatus Aenigmarchaeota archaeon]